MGNSGEIGKEETFEKVRKNAKWRFETVENGQKWEKNLEKRMKTLEKIGQIFSVTQVVT